MVLAWAARLGTFLFRRVSRDGGDSRFAERKKDPLVFFTVWNIQGLWVTTTALAAWTAVTSAERAPLGWPAVLGVAVWLLGFGIEVVADAQTARTARLTHLSGHVPPWGTAGPSDTLT